MNGRDLDDRADPGSVPASVSPLVWSEDLMRSLSPTPQARAHHGLVRTWSGPNVAIDQPPLDHHLVVVHLGGDKRIERIGAGGAIDVAIPAGAVTIVPAGEQYQWRTLGPIEFIHFYVDPNRFNRSVETIFDRDHSGIMVGGKVGVTDSLLAELVKAIALEAERPDPLRAQYLEALIEGALARLALNHSTLAAVRRRPRYALAPSRLRRVLNFVEASLGAPLNLDQLAAEAGLSRFHFSRAFRQATGETPLAFVARRRIEVAKLAIRRAEEPLAAVATRLGFQSSSHFSTTFRRVTGLSPSGYREHYHAGAQAPALSPER